jgi:hypothetical protein
MTYPFPIIIADYDHHAWRNWVLEFPFALLADADVRPLQWVHHEDLKPCKRVVVGLHVTPQFISEQLCSTVPVTPNDVRYHLLSGTP